MLFKGTFRLSERESAPACRRRLHVNPARKIHRSLTDTGQVSAPIHQRSCKSSKYKIQNSLWNILNTSGAIISEQASWQFMFLNETVLPLHSGHTSVFTPHDLYRKMSGHFHLILLTFTFRSNLITASNRFEEFKKNDELISFQVLHVPLRIWENRLSFYRIFVYRVKSL